MSRMVQQSLISARFLVTFGHLVALLVLFPLIEHNVRVSLPDNYSDHQRQSAMTSAWVGISLSVPIRVPFITLITLGCLNICTGLLLAGLLWNFRWDIHFPLQSTTFFAIHRIFVHETFNRVT